MFTFNVSAQNNHLQLVFGGELTIYSASALFNEHIKALQMEDSISLDLSEVEEIDTAGAQILLFLFAEAARQEKSCQLTAFSEAVGRYIRLFNLQSHFALNTTDGESIT